MKKSEIAEWHEEKCKEVDSLHEKEMSELVQNESDEFFKAKNELEKNWMIKRKKIDDERIRLIAESNAAAKAAFLSKNK